MMFIIRTSGEEPSGTGFAIRKARRTPALGSGGTRDFFCDGDIASAKEQKFNVVPVHDGWYADDTGGGVAIWGQGQFWEIRDTPFAVRETSVDSAMPASDAGRDGDVVNVRKAIFGV
jgi:hypothetical protein